MKKSKKIAGPHFGDRLTRYALFIQPLESASYEIDILKQFIVNALTCLDALQLLQNEGKLIFQRFVDLGVALDNDIASQAAAIYPLESISSLSLLIILYIDVFMFFRRYTETDRDAAEAIVFIKILCRHN